jgi:predicted  nucleic acid-binding Zn-ribbon protein
MIKRLNNVRLSMDEVRKQHDGIKKLYEQGLRGATASVEQVLDLFDTIEALQQENEQLQAQVARMREALRKAREAIKAAWSDGSANAAMDKASEALAEIDKAIGGKEDV